MLSRSFFTDVLLMVVSYSGVIAYSACLGFLLFRLKLNHHIKRILLIYTFANLIGQVISAINVTIVLIFHLQSFTTCSLFYGPTITNLGAEHVMTALIAVIRFHMASNTADNERIDHKYINVLTFSVTGGYYLLIGICFFLNGVLSNGVFMMIANCAGIGNQNGNGGNRGVLGVFALYVLASLAVGSFHDAKMVNLIRARAQVEPIILATWQPPTRRDPSQDLKDTIPVNATILSTLSIVMIIGGAIPFWIFNMNIGQIEVELTIIILVWSGMHMPLILGLTVKSQHKKARVEPQVPRGLQFHEEEEEAPNLNQRY